MRAEKSNHSDSEFISENLREIVEVVHPVIADGFALYEKTKNFYLHLAGADSRNYQPLFDEQAQEIFDSIDMLAEQLRRIGATTIPSVSHTGELLSIESYLSDFLSPGKMIEQLAADNQQIVVSLLIASNTCNNLRETSLSNTLQNVLYQTERRIRFLSEAKMSI